MLSRLRWQLTSLYAAAVAVVFALMTLSIYALLSDYFQRTTDLGLQHKMAHEFRLLGAPLPPELAAADRDWLARRAILLPRAPYSHGPHPPEDDFAEEFYDSELSAIFVLPLDAEARLLFDPNPTRPPLVPDAAAVAAALQHGSDLRTITLANGTPVRLLTYPLTRSDGPAVLQLGRALIDQQRILGQLILILSVVGLLGAGVVGGGSWWLAGRAIQPAQQAWQRQQLFVSNASHELRTPLALIRASAEAALRRLPPEPHRVHELLHDLIQECDHTTTLVQDLLLLSRLDAGHMVLTQEVLAVHDVLETVARHVTPLAEAHGIQLTLQPTTETICGDATRLHQVLLIVLDNALRHTPQGGQIRLYAMPSGAGQIALCVTDTGTGIAPADLPHIFERFYRSAHARTHTGGNGLGLAIARSLVTAMHGQISVTSQLGQGTTVTIRMPMGTGGRG